MSNQRITGLSMAAVLLLVTVGFVSMTHAQATSQPADATGNWKWTVQGRDGTPNETTLKLKQDGDKLTGTISGRRGDTEIKDGAIKDGQITFKVVRTFNDQEFTTDYAGKLDGDTIKGKITFNLGGEARDREWEAKRDTGMATTKPSM